MTDRPFFSVIIPVYKVEKYLSDCIDSILTQNCDDYEIILVDDGSPDKCPLICDRYAEKYSNITVVHKENGGLSDARNFGIKASNGTWLIFLDSDDKLANENVLAMLKAFIQKDSAKLVYCPCLARFSDTVLPQFSKYFNTEKITPAELFNYVHESGSLFAACLFVTKRQNIIQNKLYFTKGILHEDMDWIPRLLLTNAKGNLISIFPNDFYLYRVNDKSITSSFSKNRFDGYLYTIKWITEIRELSPFLRLWINMLFYTLFINLKSEIKNKKQFDIYLRDLQLYMRKNKKILNKRNSLILHLGRTGVCLFYKLRGLVK